MNTDPKTTALATTPKPSALGVMASKYNVDATKLYETLRETVFKGASNEELMALVIVANQYGLNPFTREIYAFPKKGGGISAVVGIDGWLRIMNDQPTFDGIEYQFSGEGADMACTATIHVKGRSKPVSVTEYMAECRRETDPWRTCPRRMLRHKTTIQAARVAFGLPGQLDEDSATEVEATATVTTVDPPPKREEKPATVTAPAGDTAEKAPHTELEATVISAGFTFPQFVTWAGKGQHVKDADSLSGWEDIPPDVCKRLLRAKSGMLNQLAAEGGVK